MRKKLALIPFMLSMAFAGQSQAALTDGVYETTVNGHNAPMTVKVTIKDADLTAVIGVSCCAACSKFQIITSYDTMSVASADSSRSLRSNTARSHSTDTAADTLLTELTVRRLLFYSHLPCAGAFLLSHFLQFRVLDF